MKVGFCLLRECYVFSQKIPQIPAACSAIHCSPNCSGSWDWKKTTRESVLGNIVRPYLKHIIKNKQTNKNHNGHVIWFITMEVSMPVPRRTKNRAAIWLRHTAARLASTWCTESACHRGRGTFMFIAALVMRAKTENQARCSSTKERRKRMWCVHNGILFSLEEEWNHDTCWKADGTGHDHRQKKPQKDKCDVFSLICRT